MKTFEFTAVLTLSGDDTLTRQEAQNAARAFEQSVNKHAESLQAKGRAVKFTLLPGAARASE